MPRLRFVPPDRLESYAAKHAGYNGGDRPPATDAAAFFDDDDENKRRIEAAGFLALGPDGYREFLEDVNLALTVTQRAEKYGVGRSTAFERYRRERHLVLLAWITIRLHEALGDCDGGTVHPTTGAFLPPGPGYLVSLAEFGRRFDALPSPDDIFQWLRKHRRALSDGDRTLYPGVWRADRLHWLCDLNLLIAERQQAFSIALREGQRSVFDNLRRTVLSVPQPGRRAA